MAKMDRHRPATGQSDIRDPTSSSVRVARINAKNNSLSVPWLLRAPSTKVSCVGPCTAAGDPELERARIVRLLFTWSSIKIQTYTSAPASHTKSAPFFFSYLLQCFSSPSSPSSLTASARRRQRLSPNRTRRHG